ncbi:hypothetical protein [Okeania sp. SIO2B3]|nr:hypothetical protein [Okeania sp. SIO2B3]NET43772.1 hypothetical protein [Okeania sp. SIO2B3]
MKNQRSTFADISHLLDVDSKYSWQFSNMAKDKKGKFSNALDILPR